MLPLKERRPEFDSQNPHEKVSTVRGTCNPRAGVTLEGWQLLSEVESSEKLFKTSWAAADRQWL